METLVHTPDGKLKGTGPVMSITCKVNGCTPNLDHEPVPCIGNGKPCQCAYCILMYGKESK